MSGALMARAPRSTKKSKAPVVSSIHAARSVAVTSSQKKSVCPSDDRGGGPAAEVALGLEVGRGRDREALGPRVGREDARRAVDRLRRPGTGDRVVEEVVVGRMDGVVVLLAGPERAGHVEVGVRPDGRRPERRATPRWCATCGSPRGSSARRCSRATSRSPSGLIATRSVATARDPSICGAPKAPGAVARSAYWIDAFAPVPCVHTIDSSSGVMASSESAELVETSSKTPAAQEASRWHTAAGGGGNPPPSSVGAPASV